LRTPHQLLLNGVGLHPEYGLSIDASEKNSNPSSLSKEALFVMCDSQSMIAAVCILT
jgi:hypothetical protein